MQLGDFIEILVGDEGISFLCNLAILLWGFCFCVFSFCLMGIERRRRNQSFLVVVSNWVLF